MPQFIPEEYERMNAIATKIANLIQSGQPYVQNRHTWADAYHRAQELVMACHHPGVERVSPDEMVPKAHEYRLGTVCWCGEVNTDTNVRHTFKAARMENFSDTPDFKT